jgi:hypothetical protein
MAGSEYYNYDDDDGFGFRNYTKADIKAKIEANREWEAYVDGRLESTPEHYDNNIQPWDYMKATMSPEAFEGFLAGNVIKYVSRYKKKNGREDLLKAQTYITKLLEL